MGRHLVQQQDRRTAILTLGGEFRVRQNEAQEQREQAARRQTLALALARARTEFAQTASPIRRGVLSDAIADLVRQIESLVAVDAR